MRNQAMKELGYDRIWDLIKEYPRSWIYKFRKNPEFMTCVEPLIQQYGFTVQAAVYCLLHDYNPICKYGNTTKFTWFDNGFSYCGIRTKCRCNSENSALKAKQTNLSKYGNEVYTRSEEYMKKSKASCLKKYGVEYSSQLPDTRNKAKETSIKKYGVEHYTQTSESKKHVKKLNKERTTEERNKINDKRIKTCMERYNVSNPAYITIDSETLVLLKDKEKFISYITSYGKHSRLYYANKLNIDNNTITKYATEYDCLDLFCPTDSKWETIICEFLDSNNINYVHNERKIINPYELDFYFPDHNAAIELNGNYWHSELAGGKDKMYHYNKWLLCKNKGIDLYSYFEDELIDNIDIIKAKINYICHLNNNCIIGARKIQLSSVTYKQERQLLEKHHIQGTLGARNNSIGAYHNYKLVAIIAWSFRKQYLEITRYCCDTNASYPGLFSKMMTAMIKQLDFKGQIVSFSNNGHSNGGVYKASGFMIAKILGPAYWYTYNYLNRENRQKYMKSDISKKFNDPRFLYENKENWTEWQAMKELGYDRIWDSGKIKWVLEIGE